MTLIIWFSSILASKFLWLLEQEWSIIRVYILCKQDKTSEEHKQHLQFHLEIWEIGITNIREQYRDKRRLKSIYFDSFLCVLTPESSNLGWNSVTRTSSYWGQKSFWNSKMKKTEFQLKKKWKLIFQPHVWSPSCQVSKTANQLPITKKHNEVSVLR